MDKFKDSIAELLFSCTKPNPKPPKLQRLYLEEEAECSDSSSDFELSFSSFFGIRRDGRI